MRVLIWTPPWIGQNGDPLFFEGALRGHLARQASTLVRAGCDVTLVAGELLLDRLEGLDPKIRVDEISLADASQMTRGLGDPAAELYREPRSELAKHIERELAPRLTADYDAALVWETPVPFLSSLLPDAVVIRQMPGAFSRAPYPHTVTADPRGLYRSGTLAAAANEILSIDPDARSRALARDFIAAARESILATSRIDREMLDPGARFERLVLLPLQISGHYAFRVDTGYRSQAELLLEVMAAAPPDVGVVVTQYISRHISERALTEDLVRSLRARYPNFLYSPDLEEVANCSQFVLPLVDAVYTCSSSLGFQALLWDCKLLVSKPTFVQPFADASGFDGLEGPSAATRGERIIATLLSRHQPLFHKIVDDGAFLLGLIEDMSSRRSRGRTGLDALPTFLDLDAGYQDAVLSRFRPNEVRRATPPSPPRAEHGWQAPLRRALTDPVVRVISFDVFDTLVDRPLSSPAHLFSLLELSAMRILGMRASGLAEVRRDAEVMARRKATADEVTLDGIYFELQSVLGFEDEVVAQLRELELGLELRLCRARRSGQALWRMAQASGRRIIAVSDMYLPKASVAEILRQCGYRDYHELYLSSELGVRKHSGALFDAVVQDIGEPAASILHVGDNPFIDGQQAEARGLRTFLLPRAVKQMTDHVRRRSNDPETHPRGLEIPSSVVNAMVAQRLFDEPTLPTEAPTLFRGDAGHLGYAGLGPPVAGFSLWLAARAREHGVDRLFFLSREGDILKQVFDALHPVGEGHPPTEYLYASRRALLVAAIHERADIASVAAREFQHEAVSVGELLERRFGLPASQITAAALLEGGYSSLDAPVRANAAGKHAFRSLCLALEGPILEIASAERESYLAYLRELGFDRAERPAIVDLGWGGNMQAALSRLVDREIIGYYYVTLDTALRWRSVGNRLYGYAGEFAEPASHPSSITQNRPIAEYLLCNSDRSLVRMERVSGRSEPSFAPAEEPAARVRLVRSVHRGVLGFARDLRERLGEGVQQLAIDPFFAERWLASFLENPTPEDARLLVGHHSEDSFGGHPLRYLIAPLDTPRGRFISDSFWTAGARAAAPLRRSGLLGRTRLAAAGVPRLARTGVLRAEASLVRRFVPARKQNKYSADRRAFFEDSQSALARWWARQL